MLEFCGDHARCKVFVDELENNARQQIYDFLNHPAFEGMTIRIMPDVHAGAGAVIGFTGTLTDKIVPNVIGVDIGCGVTAVKLLTVMDRDFTDKEFKSFDQFVRMHVPNGHGVRQKEYPYDAALMQQCEEVALATGQNPDYVRKSLGSLGGGNHFIELDKDQNGGLWLVVHSGSRNFGLKIANYHQQQAVPTVGRGRGLEWLEGEKAQLYFKHMSVAQKFAAANRRVMLSVMGEHFNRRLCGPFTDLPIVESVHNYINFDDKVIRKGAISAHKGERVIIPWNMRDGTIIGTGKGNSEWNNSAPHGAGRIMGRNEAKRTLSLEEFQTTMSGIWTSCVSAKTLDEAPMAYKDPQPIIDVINDTIELELILKPIYNFKASE